MSTIVRFEDIEAWQTVRKLTSQIYEITRHGEFARDYSLCDQMRRATVSVMSNIAEGFESRTQPLFKDFLSRAIASAGELRTQLYVERDIGYLNQDEFPQLFELCDKCSRQIARFIQYLIHQSQAVRDEGIIYNV